ncbi:ABC transporter permease [Catenuloplanes indicus]|uniref:Peptide/nickel transport system permease protein n=1 Tax=Catenuloplanes indicus TaxID=137267 RepID=A0AAE3VUJ4_9ACTN|nr:ABC transporter permease [Catenuloplanes indicus]MDQ0363547.1 peptide/nickel transport system permease protein [Catenuloplanes indicus]
MNWGRFLILRLGAGALALAAVSALVFAATDVLPGDAAGVLGGADATDAERAALRAELGLDRPAHVRYLDWAGSLLRGDLGTALVGGRPVSDLLADRLPHSALIAGLSLAVVAPLSIACGLAAGLRQGRARDRVISGATLLGVALPEFVVASLLITVFATWLGLLPRVSLIPIGGGPLDTPEILVLPVLSTVAVGLAGATRLIRASAAEVAASPFVEAARLRGVTGVRLAVRHVLPNAIGPAVQSLALVTAALTGGAVVIETIFNYPGLGYELQRAVANRDIPVVQGLTVVLAGIALLVLLTADIVTRLADPRQGRHG